MQEKIIFNLTNWTRVKMHDVGKQSGLTLLKVSLISCYMTTKKDLIHSYSAVNCIHTVVYFHVTGPERVLELYVYCQGKLEVYFKICGFLREHV